MTQRIIALALLAHLALSWPLWHPGYRTLFPMLPLFNLAFPQTEIWAGTHAWLTVGFTLLLLWMPQRRWVVAAATGWFLWMIVQDMNRLQPWMYFYLLALGLIWTHFHGKAADAKADTFEKKDFTQRRKDAKRAGFNLRAFSPLRETIFNKQSSLRWLLAAVYAWGGFNKLTPYFAEDNFPWFCEAFFWTKPLGAWPLAGYSVALAELLFAPGLLWSVTRPAFRWIVPAFHLFILTALSPFGLDWNTVVIPWNVAMGAMVWILFAPGGNRRQRSAEGPFFSPRRHEGTAVLPTAATNISPGLHVSVVKKRNHLFAFIILLLAWIMPVLNIFHLWDEPLSWKMYSNTQTEATYYRDSQNAGSAEWQALWDKHAYDHGKKLLLDDWAFGELHVPLYNNRRTFIQTARYLCDHSVKSASTGLLLLTVNRWDKSAEKWENIPCDHIQE